MSTVSCITCLMIMNLIRVSMCALMSLTQGDSNVNIILYRTKALEFYRCMGAKTSDRCTLLLTHSENSSYIASDVEIRESSTVECNPTYQCLLETVEELYCHRGYCYTLIVHCQRISTMDFNNSDIGHNALFLIKWPNEKDIFHDEKFVIEKRNVSTFAFLYAPESLPIVNTQYTKCLVQSSAVLAERVNIIVIASVVLSLCVLLVILLLLVLCIKTIVNRNRRVHNRHNAYTSYHDRSSSSGGYAILEVNVHTLDHHQLSLVLF